MRRNRKKGTQSGTEMGERRKNIVRERRENEKN